MGKNLVVDFWDVDFVMVCFSYFIGDCEEVQWYVGYMILVIFDGGKFCWLIFQYVEVVKIVDDDLNGYEDGGELQCYGY